MAERPIALPPARRSARASNNPYSIRSRHRFATGLSEMHNANESRAGIAS
jgi:hypothetical protein